MTQPKTILLVEDNPDDIFLLQRAFTDAGMRAPLQVLSVAAEAIRYLTGAGAYSDRRKHPFPNLLLLDAKLESGSGLDVLRWLKERPHLRQGLVAIVLSADELPEQKDMAYTLGANSYLVKPFEYKRLQEIALLIKEYWLELNRLPSVPQPDSSR